jgi:hypothetical protein
MEIRNVNSFVIDSELTSNKNFPYAFYFTNGAESEFKELLNNFLSEYEIKDDSKFNPGVFTAYVAKNGFYLNVGEYPLCEGGDESNHYI